MCANTSRRNKRREAGFARIRRRALFTAEFSRIRLQQNVSTSPARSLSGTSDGNSRASLTASPACKESNTPEPDSS